MFGLKPRGKSAEGRPHVPQFAECERATAGPTSPFHIRRVNDGKLFPGGGADTLALCGAKVAWDTRAIALDEFADGAKHQHETFRVCSGCLTVVESMIAEVASA